MEQTPENEATGVPLTLLVGYLAAFGLLLAFYFFIVFCSARGLVSGIGFSLSVAVRCLGATLVMAGFIVWLAPLTEALELWYLHRRPAWRYARGLCPMCGYKLSVDWTDGAAANKRCAECGADQRLPEPWQLGASALRRFALVGSAAFIVGCVAATWSISADEQRFLDACNQQNGRALSRPRAWPAQFSTMHFDGQRVWSTSVIETPMNTVPLPSSPGSDIRR
ncbi:MAG: hypothetical protein SGJ11_01085 [Phycisphaerae bacterium]|nr:hypothetical protein [Phycisphaerae bacterium]